MEESSTTNPSPYLHLVPKDLKRNLAFRMEMRLWAARDEGAQRQLLAMCREDLLFWVNAFVETYDPRDDDIPSEIPFITYPYQDEGLLEIDASVGSHDVVVEKSRDMGASWSFLLVYVRRWLFKGMQSFDLISRNEDYVDKPGNPKCLFWKIDFLLDRLPPWMLPRAGYVRTKLHLENKDNGSVIDGESTTGDCARGDRRTAIMLDEFASFGIEEGFKALAATQAATRCRHFNSTPKGTGNAHYSMVTIGVKKLRWHWSMHPVMSRGLYSSTKGKLQIIDQEYRFPNDYPFILDDKIRSPWYDFECLRTPVASLIAQELDIDYTGSGGRFFTDALLGSAEKCVVPPYRYAEIVDGKLVDDAAGRVRLWLHNTSPISTGRFVVACDISQGTGASNSCFCVANELGEKVAEFCWPHIGPEAFATYVLVIAQHFNGAFLIWEANGPGRGFGNQIIEEGYRNIYWKSRKESGFVFESKTVDFPGWSSTPDKKEAMLMAYRLALAKDEYTNRSEWAVNECREYGFDNKGKPVHQKSLSTIDPTGARDNHGDLVIADGLCVMGLKRTGAWKREIKIETTFNPHSVGGRRAAHRRKAKQKVLW